MQLGRLRPVFVVAIVALLAAGCASSSGLTGLGGASGDVTTSQRNFVLILQDAAPWGTAHNQGILTYAGIPFDVRTSAQFTANPSLVYGYKVVVIAGDQPGGFYTAVAALNAVLEAYVNRGGILNYNAAPCGWNDGGCDGLSLPFGMGVVHRYDSDNDVVLNAHRLVAGVPDPFWGNPASHGYVTGTGFTTVATEKAFAVDGPTLVFRTGAAGVGRMVVSTQPLEYACQNGQYGGTIFENDYMWKTERMRMVDLSPYCALDNGNNEAAGQRTSRGR